MIFLYKWRLDLISNIEEVTIIPCPLLEFSAGFTIQIVVFFFPSL